MALEICIKTAKSQQKNRKQFASRPKGSPPHTLISCRDYTSIIYRFGCLKDLGPMRGKKTSKSLQNTKHNITTDRLMWPVEYYYPAWLRNRLIFARIEPFLCHTEKSCIVSYYRQFFRNVKEKS